MTAASKAGGVFSLALALIIVLGIGTYASLQRLLEANESLHHADLVLEKLEHVLFILTNAETGQRGYVLTGEERYLKPYNSAVGLIQSDFGLLKELARNNPAQQESLQKVQPLIDAKLAELKKTIELRRESGLEGALPEILTDRGQKIMEDLRGVFDEMERREQSLLIARTNAADLSAHRIILTLSVWTPLSLLLLAIAAVLVLRKMRFDAPIALEPLHRHAWRLIAMRYCFAVLVVIIATILRRWFDPIPLYITFYPAVLLVAIIAGGGPGILATMLSALAADYFFIPPIGTFAITSTHDLIGIAIFTGTNLFLCTLSERLRRSRWVEAVAQQKELLAVTLASIGEGVIVTDVQGRITFVNGAAEQLNGWKSAEAQGKPLPSVFRIINDVTRGPVDNLVDTVLRQGSSVGLADHAILIARDGREISIEQNCALVRSQEGDVRGTVISFRDVTERKQTQDQLQLHLRVLESAANAIVITGPDGSVRWVNPAFTRLTGYEAADAIGLNPRVLKSGRQDPAFYKHLWQAISAGQVWHGELVNRRKDGALYDEEMTITPVCNAAGQITHFVAIKQDITQRKHADEAQALLAAIVESSDDAILSKSLDGTILSWNAGAQRLFGYGAEEIIGKPITQLLPPERIEELEQIMARLSRGERIEYHETVRVAKDGRGIEVSLTISPIKDRQGYVVGASTIHHDITQRKRVEMALKRTAQELARSNQDLEQFASVASHDLQEPLRMVSGYLQLIERRYKDKLDADVQEFIGFAVDGATRMSRLVSDLLDYSRINTRGKQPEPVAMESVLARALENLQAAIRDSDAAITHDPLPTVQGDASQLVQLLQNLVGNAIKFRAADRPVRVYIAAQKKDDEWVFSVKDEGIGIEPQYAQKIFLIFQRLHSRAEYPGTGIGLAVCKKIVERHGGRIWVESRSGQGATFFFTIGHAEMTR